MPNNPFEALRRCDVLRVMYYNPHFFRAMAINERTQGLEPISMLEPSMTALFS